MARSSVKQEAVSDEAGVVSAKTAEPDETQRVYCGPTIKGIASQNAIFIGELPATLADAAGKCKAIERLIVPIEQFPTTRTAAVTPGTPEYAFFRKAAEYGKGVK